MRLLSAAALALAFAASVAPLAAQGTVSTQGFGYPTGQLGARARAMGGGPGELDPISALNPATIVALVRAGVYFEYAPEWRQVTTSSGTEGSAVSRFPIAAANIAIGTRWMIGLSTSTLLDRSWETVNQIAIGQPPDTATAIATFRASGAMNDVRISGAYRLHQTLNIGLGIHALTGESRTERQLVVPDSAQFIPALERRRFGYSGSGVSVGATWRPRADLGIGASARTGGTVSASSGDTTLSTADFPTRFGGSVEFTGIRGIALAGRLGWTGWSNLESLSLTDVPVTDAWEYGIGLEGRGPSVFGIDPPLRVGFRRRTLPFGLPDGSEVSENGISGGFGIPVAGGRGALDLTIERLVRDAPGEASERAWVVGIGMLLRL
jgi:hypothetical protein